MKIAIGIPCYNCENQIPRALREIDSVLSHMPEILEVLIIDNRSTDNTLNTSIETIKTLKHKSKFSVYKNKLNVGLGGSHKVAFNLTNQKNLTHLMIFHGDHQASALDMENLVRLSLQNDNVTALGSRFINLQLLNGYSYIRIAGNIALNWLYSACTFKKIHDLGSGLNLFNIKDIQQDQLKTFDNGFTFNMDLLLHLIDQKVNFKYVPIRWSTTDQISNAHAFKVGFKTLTKLATWLLKKKSVSIGTYETELLFRG